MPSKHTVATEYPQAVLRQIEQLAQNIVIARKRRKETQAQWAARLGVSQPTMARIERGDPSVSMASYVMCLWLINQAQGLADLIAPQKDVASLEREVARTRPWPRANARRAAKAGTTGYETAASPLSANHAVAEPQTKTIHPALPELSSRAANSTAAGLAALISGTPKARP